MSIVNMSIVQPFIKALFLMSAFEQRLSFRIFYFMDKDREIIFNCMCRPRVHSEALVGSGDNFGSFTSGGKKIVDNRRNLIS